MSVGSVSRFQNIFPGSTTYSQNVFTHLFFLSCQKDSLPTCCHTCHTYFTISYYVLSYLIFIFRPISWGLGSCRRRALANWQDKMHRSAPCFLRMFFFFFRRSEFSESVQCRSNPFQQSCRETGWSHAHSIGFQDARICEKLFALKQADLTNQILPSLSWLPTSFAYVCMFAAYVCMSIA